MNNTHNSLVIAIVVYVETGIYRGPFCVGSLEVESAIGIGETLGHEGVYHWNDEDVWEEDSRGYLGRPRRA